MANASAPEILRTALAWLEENHQVILVTVAKTWGSSPRPVGSMLLMREDGRHVGSVSGGCIEEDLLTGEFTSPLPHILEYGITSEQAHRFGLPCGGALTLVVEHITERTWLETILAALERSELIGRQLNLTNGEVTLLPATPEDTFRYTTDSLQQVFGPTWQLLLIGAGQLSHYVAQIGLMLGYQVIVCDPRETYHGNWQLLDVEMTRMMPDDAVKQFVSHQRGIVVTLTHDPKLDDMAVWEALQSPAFYVGALGSKRASDTRRLRLQKLGVTPEHIARLHAPVGIDIGSHTPAEIAVSVMAEITAIRNRIA